MQDKDTATSRSMTGAHAPESQIKERRRKSRAGCRNCKLRKLKCDETRPQCKRCTTYGVVCNIKFNVPDLQPVSERPTRQIARTATVDSPRPAISNGLWTADAVTSFTLDEKARDLLNVYRTHSTHSRDDNASGWRETKEQLLRLAFVHPFLMHAVLSLGAVYERYLTTHRRSLRETHHFSECTSLFNRRLSLPVPPQDRDALWGTAATLAILSFSSLDATTPDESWPLRAPDSSDLEWMRIGDGKKAVWQITDPLRPDSLFSSMATTFAEMYSPLPEVGIDGVDVALARVCGLDECSTAQSSPFFTVVHSVSKLYSLPDEQLTNGRAFSFGTHMQPAFKTLLEGKDPVALLILYLWYRRARIAVWWVELRARVECPAICLYLRRYHADSTGIHAFLSREDWPLP